MKFTSFLALGGNKGGLQGVIKGFFKSPFTPPYKISVIGAHMRAGAGAE